MSHITMQRLTRHVSVIRVTYRRRNNINNIIIISSAAMARDQVVSFRHFVTVGYHFNVLDRFSCFCAAGVAGGEAVEQRSVGVRDRRRDRPNVARTGRRRQAAVLRVIHWCQGTAAAECVSCFGTVSFIRGAQNMHIKIWPCIFAASFAFIGLQWFGRNAWIKLVKQKVQDLVI